MPFVSFISISMLSLSTVEGRVSLMSPQIPNNKISVLSAAVLCTEKATRRHHGNIVGKWVSLFVCGSINQFIISRLTCMIGVSNCDEMAPGTDTAS